MPGRTVMRQARSQKRRPLLLADLERQYLNDYEPFGGLLFIFEAKHVSIEVLRLFEIIDPGSTSASRYAL